MSRTLLGAQVLDTEKLLQSLSLKLLTFPLNVWIKVVTLSSEFLDNCPELKLLMFKILLGAQALDKEKHLQSLSSRHSD